MTHKKINRDIVWFSSIDPKGYQEEIERNNPKLKYKPNRKQEFSVIMLNYLGSVRPKLQMLANEK